MKELIRKVLREAIILTSDTPDWVERFHDLSRQERIEFIKKYKKDIQSSLPMITEFFESKYEELLVMIEVDERRSHYGNEDFSFGKILLKFYFKPSGTEKINGRKIKNEIYKDLKSFFNIDIAYYGTPIEYEVYEMTWQKV